MIKVISSILFVLTLSNIAIAKSHLLLTDQSLATLCQADEMLSLYEEVDGINYYNGDSFTYYKTQQVFEAEVKSGSSTISQVELLKRYLANHESSQVSMVIQKQEVVLKDWLSTIAQAQKQNVSLNLYIQNTVSTSNNTNFPISKQSDQDSSINILSYQCLTHYAISTSEIRAQLAQRLGIPERQLTRTTQLRSLTLDQYDFHEAKAMFADKYKLNEPIPFKVMTLEELTKHINQAEHTRGVVMRGLGEDLIKQTVFYGTNRLKVITDKKLGYGGLRTDLLENEYGSCTVTLPKSHKKGALERPFMGLEFFQDETKHVLLRQVNPLSQAEFLGQIDRKQTHSSNDTYQDDIVIFIHGFNVTFESAALRTAQIANDIGFEGAPIFFSWPSDGQLLAYTRDREDAVWSRAYLENFLNLIAIEKPNQDIHIIAHSMGNQVLLGALHQMALRNDKPLTERFSSIILAAPDFDAELFAEQIAPEVASMSSNWTIYTSDKDAALNISATVNATPRLGQPITPIANMQVIDATGVEVTPWSVPEFHSYYATKQRVIDDLIAVIKGTPVSQRNLQARSTKGISYWKLN